MVSFSTKEGKDGPFKKLNKNISEYPTNHNGHLLYHWESIVIIHLSTRTCLLSACGLELEAAIATKYPHTNCLGYGLVR